MTILLYYGIPIAQKQLIKNKTSLYVKKKEILHPMTS